MKAAPVQSVIQTQDLSVGYAHGRKENVLFENLSLGLKPGELTCFMGPNGVGKSTLIRTFLGLQKPLAGSFHIQHSPAPGQKTGVQARQVAAVLSDRISAVNMNAYELVSFGRYPYLGWDARLTPEDHAIVQRWMDYVHIQHLATRRIYEVSDGQLQMIMIARALAQETPIILLDEPTAHLDLNNRVEIMNLLRDLAHTMGKAILVATHELDLALQTADAIWLAGHQKQVLTGIPEDLVLNGAFDQIFRLKGFDLRTGKLQHVAYRATSVRLEGNGHAYLWTKNALERIGFSIAAAGESSRVHIEETQTHFRWVLDDQYSFENISELITHLISGRGLN